MEQAIANVVRVDIITEDTPPMLMRTSTSDEAGQEPIISEGTETPLRSKNRILAQNNTEDLVLGYIITLKELIVDADTFALVDGGTLTWDAEKKFFVYDGPETGAVISRKKATIDIWTEEKDADGDTVGHLRFRYRNGKGSPVKFTHKDNAFFAPEYVLKARPKLGQKPVNIANFVGLPPEDLTAQELLEWTREKEAALPPAD